MDPYLEGPLWTSVHTHLSVEIARQISPRLSDRYVARSNERFVTVTGDADDGVEIVTSSIYPDAYVAETNALEYRRPEGGILAVAPAPLHVQTVMPEKQRLLTVEILDVAKMRLVTAIEVLSPTNKKGNTRQEYLDKRERILLSAAHLVEIDLLRAGKRVPTRERLPAFPYFILISRAEKRPVLDVWPVPITSKLPVIPVPLLDGDPDVALDLQAALDSVYEIFRYGRSINYSQPAPGPLRASEKQWVEERLNAQRSQQ
jgi:hypothetical protein